MSPPAVQDEEAEAGFGIVGIIGALAIGLPSTLPPAAAQQPGSVLFGAVEVIR